MATIIIPDGLSVSSYAQTMKEELIINCSDWGSGLNALTPLTLSTFFPFWLRSRRNDPVEAGRIFSSVGVGEGKWVCGREQRADLHPGVGVPRFGGRLDQNSLQDRAAFGSSELKTRAGGSQSGHQQ